MSLPIGTRLGPYEILAAIGAGGMGEVYRARDTRLDRTIAIKVCAAQFSERFEREARAVAALNHPHIYQLYDVGPDYLVMEYIDGQALRGPLPVDQAVVLAVQIAEALDAAHRKGITHRDLKPANILVTKAGVKLLDFGLAKQHEKPTAMPEQTVTLALTAAHTVVGTPQYMAPEQIEGRDADARTDIFAFGCVLYEMLTGRKAFEGRSPSTAMAAVLATEPPPISTIQPGAVPAALERAVRTCLAKDPDERWQSARDLKHALEWAGEAVPQAAPAIPRRRNWLPWAIAALLAAALPALWLLRPKPADAPLVQLELSAPEGTAYTGSNIYRYAISPDGKRLAFVAATPDGKRALWLRPLDSPTGRRLPGTDGAAAPFWSPDNHWVAFSAGAKLMRLDVNGGVPQTICAVAGSFDGGTWNREGTILFADAGNSILRVSASGGTPAPVLPFVKSREEYRQRDPQFLPDGRRFLYYSNGKSGGIVLGSIEGKGRFLMENPQSPSSYVVAGDGRGFLLFVRGGQLMTQAFNANSGKLSGEAVPLAEDLSVGPTWSASDNGVLVFRHARGSDTQLTWFDREGKLLGTAGDPGRIFSPRISPDQKTIAVHRSDGTKVDVWLFDLRRGNSTRFTFAPGSNSWPVWSPDGSKIIYFSTGPGGRAIMERPSNGIGGESIRLRFDGSYFPESCSPDGHWLVMLHSQDALYLLPLATPESGERKPIPFQQPAFEERDGFISPDSQWMLYSSTQTGRREVFVQSLPGAHAAGKWQISTAGGAQPAWRADGKEIFFLAADGKMMSVPVEPGAVLQPGVSKALFQTRLEFDSFRRAYDVSADGKRFILANPLSAADHAPIVVILNWPALLKK